MKASSHQRSVAKDYVYRLLLEAEKGNQVQFVNDLRKYFSGKPDLLKYIVRHADSGKFFQGQVEDILEETKKVLKCSHRAIKAVIDLDIPISRYRAFKHLNKVMNDGGDEFVDPEVFGVKVPNFWAGSGTTEREWKKYKDKFNIQHTGDGKDSHMWDVLQWVRFVYNSPTYQRYIRDPTNLEIIVRGDGLPVGSDHACFMIVTLGNFGVLSKTLPFNYVINLAEVSEKNREHVRQAFRANINTLNQWVTDGVINLFPELGIVVNVQVEWGGDESWLRMLLGLLSSKEQLACLKCLWKRGEKLQGRIPRVLIALVHFAERGTIDQESYPLVTQGTITKFHHCAMHGCMAYGKDMCQCIFDHAALMEAIGLPVWDHLTAWFKKHHITEPLYGNWNIQASHTWELMKNWKDLCDTIYMHYDEYDLLVGELMEKFHLVYHWEFKSEGEKAALRHFECTVGAFVDCWRLVMGKGKERNYYHWLAVEAAIQIRESGSIWKYASDITESYVHVIKVAYYRFSNKGGFGRYWTDQVMYRLLIKAAVQSFSNDDALKMLSVYEQKKIVAQLQNIIDEYN